MKAKNAVWRTRDGREICIRDMEDSHLTNLGTYLVKRQSEFDQLVQLALQMGQRISPVLVIYGHPLNDWLECVVEELARRRRKDADWLNKLLGGR